MDFYNIIIIFGIILILFATLFGLFASRRSIWINCRLCMAGGHIVFIIVVGVISYLMRNEAQACMYWLPVYNLDMPSSLLYALIHTQNPEVSICGKWIVPYVFFGGFGTLQYFLLGWIVDKIFSKVKKRIII